MIGFIQQHTDSDIATANKNYTYLDLLGADADANSIILQNEINRVVQLTPYGAPLSDFNRYTIYATGNTMRIKLYPYINLCSPAGYLSIGNLDNASSVGGQDFTNIILASDFDVTQFDNFINGVRIENLKFIGCSLYSSFRLTLAGSVKIIDSLFYSNFKLVNVGKLFIRNSEFLATPEFTNCIGLIQSSVLDDVNVNETVLLRDCLDPNFNRINDTAFYKTITSNTSINNSFHNSIAYIKASVLLTLEPNLRKDFNCIMEISTGCTAVYTAAIGVTISPESDGLNQTDKKVVSIKKDGVNNFILRGTN